MRSTPNELHLQDVWSVNKIICKYLGDLKTESLHKQSGSVLRTDAPLDHEGKGRYFCPTDLLATALGTCLLTVIGIRAKKEGWSLDGLKLDVNKQMSKFGPRKIDNLVINIFTPSNLTADKLNVLKKEIKNCPVLRNIQNSTNINFLWKKQ